MTGEEATRLYIEELRGDARYWDLHKAVAYDAGYRGVDTGSDLFAYCVERAYPQWLVEQGRVASVDEYDDAIAAREAFEGL